MNATQSVCVLVIVLCSFQPILSQTSRCECNGEEVDCDDPCIRNGFGIAGGIIGGLIFIVVMSVVLCCVCYHCKRRQLLQPPAAAVTTTSDFPANHFHSSHYS
ncbi:hypothetical protein GBAR_LOCUS26986 [Geodia barretti]|uniref:Uncharacterized protein n=1 Tax=Geodia barretti TaxID=519541 RepID=A0AA35TIN7_GEOBA|nr:hypothetical protein GBAR_LOCUS26986 [Geodia barretti]